MYIKKVTGYVVPYITKGLFDTFKPVTQESNWQKVPTEIMTVICQINMAVYGMKQILIIPVVSEIQCESYIQTMPWFSLHMITIKHFMKSFRGDLYEE